MDGGQVCRGMHVSETPPDIEWLANIATTRLYDRRRTRPEDSPTFRVAY